MTSDDIFFEIDGKRVAGVEGYNTRYSNDVRLVDAFGQGTAIGFTKGSKKYSIDISRVYLEDTAIADGIDFYSLSDYGFNFVIQKGGKRTVFKTCIISDISEDGQLKGNVGERITIMALDRVVE
jgi:hypothetical protein